MARTNLANALSTTLAASVATPDTTITLTSDVGLPTLPFYMVIDPFNDAGREYVLVEGRTGAVLDTLTRNLTGSAATTHAISDLVRVSFLAQSLDDLWTELETHTHAVPTHASTTGQGTDDHHAEAHTVASHSDTAAEGAELDTLTAGPASDADALHTHPGLGGGAVTSVFTRTGAVVAATNDYTDAQVDNTSGVVGNNVQEALDTLDASVTTGLVLGQGEVARGGATGVYSANEYVNVLDYVNPPSLIAAVQAGTSDCRPHFQSAWDTGRSVFHPKGYYRISSNNNGYAAGHAVLDDLVSAGLQVGLVDRYYGRKLFTEGTPSSGAVGGITEYTGNINGLVMLTSSLDLAAMVYVDDQTSGSDQRGGEISGFHFKDISADQHEVLSGVMVGSRWHYRVHSNGFTRIRRQSGSVVPVGSGSTLPAIEDMPGTAIMSVTDIPGAETVQYLHVYNNITERVTNGYFMYHDTPDAKIYCNMFYGAQKDESVTGGDTANSLHNQGTMIFINGLDVQTWGNNMQHTGRGMHIWGRAGKSTAVISHNDSWENPISHGWTSGERGITYGWIVDGSNIKGVHVDNPVFANGNAVGAPLYVDSSVPNGGLVLNYPVFGGLAPTGSVANNPSNRWILDSGRRTIGTYAELGVSAAKHRDYRLNESGDVVRQEITGSTPGTVSWKNNWTQGT